MDTVAQDAPATLDPQVPIDLIRVRRQEDGSVLNPRGETFSTDDLIESMRRYGQQDPLKVSWDAEERCYWLNDGHRRLASAQKLGWKHVTILVEKPDADPYMTMCLSNVRENWPPSAEARALRHAMRRYGEDQQTAGRRLGIAKNKASAILAIETKASEKVARLIEDGVLPWTVWAEMTTLSPEEQDRLLDLAARNGARVTKDWVRTQVRSGNLDKPRRERATRSRKSDGVTWTAEDAPPLVEVWGADQVVDTPETDDDSQLEDLAGEGVMRAINRLVDHMPLVAAEVEAAKGLRRSRALKGLETVRDLLDRILEKGGA